MNQNIIFIIVLIILFCMSIYGYNIQSMSQKDKKTQALKTQVLKTNSINVDVVKEDACFLYENVNRNQTIYMRLVNILNKLSHKKQIRLKDNCKETTYIAGTYDDRLKIEIRQVTEHILNRINSKTGFNFIPVYYDNITEIVDKMGNKNFVYNVYVQDPNEELTFRLFVDAVKFVDPRPKSIPPVTCAEVTTPGQDTYEIGYPKPEQFIPLPTEVISTPGWLPLSRRGVNIAYIAPIKSLYINELKIYNSNLVVHANGKCLMDQICGFYDNKLDQSLFNGPTTPFQEPACQRNKWPVLPDQPEGVKAWPCAKVSENWDQWSVFKPTCANTQTHGIQSSTVPIPVRAEYWPTHATIPRGSGPSYWLFARTRGDPAIETADFSSTTA